MCSPMTNMPSRKMRRKVSGEAAWRAFCPSQTPRKVGTMAAMAPNRLVEMECALDRQGHGERADDEQEHDAQRLHQVVPVDVERLHVGQERHGGDCR